MPTKYESTTSTEIDFFCCTGSSNHFCHFRFTDQETGTPISAFYQPADCAQPSFVRLPSPKKNRGERRRVVRRCVNRHGNVLTQYDDGSYAYRNLEPCPDAPPPEMEGTHEMMPASR